MGSGATVGIQDNEQRATSPTDQEEPQQSDAVQLVSASDSIEPPEPEQKTDVCLQFLH